MLSQWTHQGGGIVNLFAGTVTLDTPAARPHTELAVGAQLNAYAAPGSHQIVFGICARCRPTRSPAGTSSPFPDGCRLRYAGGGQLKAVC